MPGDCDGWELAMRVPTARPDIGVIYMSGYSPDPQAPVPGSLFLEKPYRLSELTAAVASVAGT